uniref:HORMA domain-containing protein n=1 Tax=Leptobrachium leishanense TaxID=445787 RepID=A0A8C5WDT7_9ANUR
MAALQKIRSPQGQATCGWSALFPVEIKTPTQSLVFVKRMMAISVSCITYLRGIFPEDAYKTRYLEDLGINILRDDSKYPRASKIIKCNKNHLLNVTMDDIKSASICLIRKLFLLMHNLGPLPGDVALTMKLFYYDAVTPPQYQPPGFKEGETHIILFEGNPVNVKLAEVSTSFHVIKVRVTTEQDRMENLNVQSILKEQEESANPGSHCAYTVSDFKLKGPYYILHAKTHGKRVNFCAKR